MIEAVAQPLLTDVAPHALFWRPTNYFAPKQFIRSESDEFDHFLAVSFRIGNRVTFELRTYQGHPTGSSTVYLSLAIMNVEEIGWQIGDIIDLLSLPVNAIGWTRGQHFEFGNVPRSELDRLREPEARNLVLKIAATRPNNEATTEEILRLIPEFTSLTDSDRTPAPARAPEERWQQIVRNVISHRNTPKGPFQRGYARRVGNRVVVTDRGLDYLKSIGFSV